MTGRKDDGAGNAGHCSRSVMKPEASLPSVELRPGDAFLGAELLDCQAACFAGGERDRAKLHGAVGSGVLAIG